MLPQYSDALAGLEVDKHGGALVGVVAVGGLRARRGPLLFVHLVVVGSSLAGHRCPPVGGLVVGGAVVLLAALARLVVEPFLAPLSVAQVAQGTSLWLAALRQVRRISARSQAGRQRGLKSRSMMLAPVSAPRLKPRTMASAAAQSCALPPAPSMLGAMLAR